MITEDYVNFETAKFLKEKGFDGILPFIYVDIEKSDREVHLTDTLCNYNDDHIKDVISAPTIQMAMKWIREKGYQIIVKHTDNNGYFANILTMNDANPVNKLFDGYMVYEQACEAAIKYCLENLI